MHKDFPYVSQTNPMELYDSVGFVCDMYFPLNGDGMRLRKIPGEDGIVMELMYRGEDITIATDVLPPPELAVWMYTRREKTGTIE